jgi:TPR repeat protein
MKKYILTILFLRSFALHLQSAETPSSSPQASPSSQAESAEQLFLKGKSCEEEGDYDRAVKLYSQAADMGNTKAMVNLGFCYEGGGGVVRDEKRAFELFDKAALSGDVKGAAKEGVMLCEGRGCTADQIKGIALLEKAAAKNEQNALRLLSIIYFYGRFGIAVDKGMGISYLKRGVEINDPVCCDILGHCYLKGDGVPYDTDMGNKLLKGSRH